MRLPSLLTKLVTGVAYDLFSPSLVEANHQNTHALREHLLGEITSPGRKCEQLQTESDHVDQSMVQTYKEMIHSRREMLAGLPRETMN